MKKNWKSLLLVVSISSYIVYSIKTAPEYKVISEKQCVEHKIIDKKICEDNTEEGAIFGALVTDSMDGALAGGFIGSTIQDCNIKKIKVCTRREKVKLCQKFVNKIVPMKKCDDYNKKILEQEKLSFNKQKTHK